MASPECRSLSAEDRVGELLGYSIHQDLVEATAQGDDGAAPPSDLAKAGLLIGADGGRVPGEGDEQDVVQAEDGKAPVECEPGGLGTEALAASLADEDAKLSGALVMVDPSVLPCPRMTSASLRQR